MKKIIPFLLLLVVLSVTAGCGGGSGSADVPGGENPGVATVVQLMPVHNITQTNSAIDLKVMVSDGNGNLIPNVGVIYTNLSQVGHLSSTTATTNGSGIAQVSLFSADSGFATIQAEVNTGSGKVRDRKIVFFSIFDLTFPPSQAATSIPTLTLAVDSNGNEIYNEPVDFVLSTGEAIIRATVHDASGVPVLNDTVTFAADTTEATFPDGDAKLTDNAGQAFARLKVVPTELRTFNTPFNVSAVSTKTGAFNVISLFMSPILVNQVTVTANPTIIDSTQTSAIRATVTTAAGTFVPDGTAVNFTATNGIVTPFGQTASGVVTGITFTPFPLAAGAADVTARVTASAGGTSGFADITVTAPKALSISPASIAVANTFENHLVFTIRGGKAPYTVTSTNPLMAFNPATGTGLWSNVTSTINVTVPTGAPAGSVTLNVTDATGIATASATITVVEPPPPVVIPPVPPPALAVAPASVTFRCADAGTAVFTITSGTSPFKVFKVLSTAPVTLGGGTPNPDGSITVSGAAGTQFTVTNASAACPLPGLPPSPVTINVLDGAAKLFTITINFAL